MYNNVHVIHIEAFKSNMGFFLAFFCAKLLIISN